ncbi:GNAT family N-acetyltransferase [Paenibacillus sp. M1]|uniref:GNAT family N-acetyltransferase n=1 Tax=Paenibacillus haidiansis TaxID=1574488 RepID=A0ABU7VQ39_9BACL
MQQKHNKSSKELIEVMELKLFERNDLLKCVNTFINVFNEEPWNDEWSAETAYRYLIDFTNTPGFIGVVAIEGEEIIGFTFGVCKRWWSGEEFFINEMCVSIKKQKSGIGSALMGFLMKKLEAAGISNITLLTDRGIPAEAFYKKIGFTEIDRLVFLNKNMK